MLTSSFETAKKWHYIAEVPHTTPPVEKNVKRKAWDAAQVYEVMEKCQEERLLHLVIHLAFVCSLRAGEIAGIDLHTVDDRDRSLWITHQVQRVSDSALAVLPRNEVIRVFPKQIASSQSSLILKSPKTEDSHRKQYLTQPLMKEIQERLVDIQEHKAFFHEEYQDYGLLICQPDGRPINPKNLETAFKSHQNRIGIPAAERLDIQGLRKSGQMHKVRLSKNDYQLVAESAGQSPEVLMSNYNEALDSEKRALSRMVEGSFYPNLGSEAARENDELLNLLVKVQSDSELRRQLLQNLLLDATYTERSE